MNSLPGAGTEVPVERLNRRCRIEELAFRTTAEITEPDGTLAQERALRAIELGVRIRATDHNIFLMGTPGSGRHLFTQRCLEQAAAKRPAPSDWCYLNRFEDPQRPKE